MKICSSVFKESGIYQILNIKTGQCYIGQSINLLKRARSHLSRLKYNKHPNRHLQSSYSKYGSDSFEFRKIQNLEFNYLDLGEAIDINTGLVLEFKTISKASKSGFRQGGITRSLKSGCKHKGYYWRDLV